MKPMIDRLVAPILAVRAGIGLSVGVVDRGRREAFGYGELGADRPLPPGADTLFEIGSITKVFTGTLLSALAAEGLLRLDEPVRDLLPELGNLPGGITLLRLATHTAGLPRVPPNLIASAIKNPDNPWAAYTIDDLLAYLSRYDRAPAEDEPFAYSNLGAGLLGHAIARRAGAPYEQAVIRRICDALDLRDTRITLSADQRRRLAEPRRDDGGAASSWDVSALPGAGALRSTARDMVAFLAANLDPPRALAPALRACHAVEVPAREPWLAEPHPAGVLHMALSWVVSRLGGGDRRVFWHNGGTGGYRSFSGFVKEKGVGVVVLSNVGAASYDMSIDALGMGLLEILCNAGDPSPPRRRSPSGGMPN